MIATLEGTLEHRGNDCVIINVGGVGFRVYVSGYTLSQLGSSVGKVFLHTHLQVRDDGAALYGFASMEELSLFRNLVSVSGIGPKAALGLLSALNPQQLLMAIASGNTDLICQAPGIGRKTAGRIVVELRGKMEKEWSETGTPMTPDGADVVSALVGLGYSLTEAAKAVSGLSGAEELSLEEKIRMALQQIAGG